MKPYPIWLNNLKGKQCVVFGGGHEGEAERKVQELLACDAVVKVVSPAFPAALAAHDRVEWIPRTYRAGDLGGAFLAIVSETNPAKTQPIWEEAQQQNVLINAMDDIPHCTFVAGSVVRRGKLVFSISTSGAAPTLAVRLRQRLEKEFGTHYEVFLDWMAALREPMSARYPDFAMRRRIWYTLADSDIIELLQEERVADAVERLIALAGRDVVEQAQIIPAQPAVSALRTTARREQAQQQDT